VVLLSAYFGRLPVVFWFLLLSTATAAWCAGAMSLESFTGARILNGFFSTVSQAGGLMFLKDIFFFHEQARKINIWACVPYLLHPLGSRKTELTEQPRLVLQWLHRRQPVRGPAVRGIHDRDPTLARAILVVFRA